MEERTWDESHEVEFVEAAPPEPNHPTEPDEGVVTVQTQAANMEGERG